MTHPLGASPALNCTGTTYEVTPACLHFRDTDHRRAACRVFLERAGHANLWSGAYPAGHGSNSAERVLLAIVEAVWNRRNLVTFSEILDVLSETELRALGGFLQAMANGPDAVDDWMRASPADGTI